MKINQKTTHSTSREGRSCQMKAVKNETVDFWVLLASYKIYYKKHQHVLLMITPNAFLSLLLKNTSDVAPLDFVSVMGGTSTVALWQLHTKGMPCERGIVR